MTETGNVHFRVTPEAHKALKLYAIKNNTTMQDLLSDAVQNIIKDKT